MAYTKIKPLMVDSFPSSRLTGAFGAISGASLTGLGDGVDTKSASASPVSNTNPSAVGHTWLNKSSGEFFVCTDATTDKNLWFNVGGGEGNIWSAQGLLYGYSAAGTGGGPSFTPTAAVQKFNFANTDSESDIGSLTVGKQAANAGTQDRTTGFLAGGHTASAGTSNISKFNFAGSFATSDHGNLTSITFNSCGFSSQTDGYACGGSVPGSYSAKIDKFAFVSMSTAASHGTLVAVNDGPTGNVQTLYYGYVCGGYPSAKSDTVNRFAFSSNGSSHDVANLTLARTNSTGFSSTVAGYINAGSTSAVPSGVASIDKILFATDNTVTGVGDLAISTISPIGVSSQTNGYVAGGGKFATEVGQTNINTLAFSSDARSEHGNLGTGTYKAGGIQN